MEVGNGNKVESIETELVFKGSKSDAENGQASTGSMIGGENMEIENEQAIVHTCIEQPTKSILSDVQVTERAYNEHATGYATQNVPATGNTNNAQATRSTSNDQTTRSSTDGQTTGSTTDGQVTGSSTNEQTAENMSKESVDIRDDSRTSDYSTADNQDYETQFFGFTPKSFSDGMYNAVLEYTYNCFQSMLQYMQEKYPRKVTEETAERASAAILPQLTHAIDKAFDKFESYLKSQICRIPPNVLLAEDVVHKTINYTPEQERQLDADIAQLEEQIACAKYMNAYMRAEMKQAEQVQLMYDQYSHFLDEIERQCYQAGVPDLREALIFNSDKAAKIKSLLDKLKQHQIPQFQYPPTA